MSGDSFATPRLFFSVDSEKRKTACSQTMSKSAKYI